MDKTLQNDIEALHRRRVQNRLAQRKRREKQAQIERETGGHRKEKSQQSHLDGRQDESTERLRDIDGPQNASLGVSGATVSSDGGPAVDNRQVNRYQCSCPDHQSQSRVREKSTLPRLGEELEYRRPHQQILPASVISPALYNPSPHPENRLDSPKQPSAEKVQWADAMLELDAFLLQTPGLPTPIGTSPSFQPDSGPAHAGPGRDHTTVEVTTNSKEDHSTRKRQFQVESAIPSDTVVLPASSERSSKDLVVAHPLRARRRSEVSFTEPLPGELTPLHLSCLRGHVDAVKSLLDYGADVDVVDRSGRTALFYAALNCQHEIVKTLVEGGADIGVSDFAGFTVLHAAAEVGCQIMIKLLVDGGADLDAKTS